MSAEFVQLSLVPLLVGILAAVTCAIPGNFLILRRQALLGDAISHVVLPGIVVAFLVTGQVTTWAMLTGATVAAVTAVLLIEAVRRLGRVEPGAAMGVVFTTMFAAGVIILEQSSARSVHLDVEHALYGNLESLVWLAADGLHAFADPAALADLPPALPRLLAVLAVVVAFHVIFWRALVVATFDEGFARMVGVPVRATSAALIVLVAVAAVAAFEAVGAIIVIAMFICPPAAARLMTDDLKRQVAWSILFAMLASVIGFFLAAEGPALFGSENAVSAAGMIATVSGLILGAAVLFGPRRQRAGTPSGV